MPTGQLPETYANCPAVLFGDVGPGSWPVGTGHPCFGCTEEGIGFNKPIHALADVQTVVPPVTYPRVDQPVGEGISAGSAALVGGLAGAAVGAGAMALSKLGKTEADESGTPEERKEG